MYEKTDMSVLVSMKYFIIDRMFFSIIKSYFNCITRCKYGKTCISQPKRTLHKSNLSIKCNAIKIVS